MKGLTAQGGYKAEEIFSEGEQRALALADFLTEVGLNPDSAGIVLDDPVTSLDHARKSAISDRLVEEARKRQVVVFTHDLVFLSLLADRSEAEGAEFTGHWVECIDKQPGYVTINETPANVKEYRNTNRAKDSLLRAKQSGGEERVTHIRGGAGSLRRTLEETVVHHLFKDTVRRWHENIRLETLRKIKWSNDVADEIVELQDATSRILEGHSHSEEFSGAMPTVEELENLINRTDAVIALAKESRILGKP